MTSNGTPFVPFAVPRKTAHTAPLMSAQEFIVLWDRARDNEPTYDKRVLQRYSPNSKEVYGEVNPLFVAEIVKEVEISCHDIFVDLGSGVGNVVLQIAATTGCKARGVEIRPELFKIGNALRATAERYLPARHKHCFDTAHFVVGDVSENIIDFSDATVVFVNNLCFPEDLEQQMLAKFQKLQDGTRVISTRSFSPRFRPFSSRFQKDPCHVFKFPWRTRLTPYDAVSWTDKPVEYYIYTVDKTPPPPMMHFRKSSPTEQAREVLLSMFSSFEPNIIETVLAALGSDLHECINCLLLVPKDDPESHISVAIENTLHRKKEAQKEGRKVVKQTARRYPATKPVPKSVQKTATVGNDSPLVDDITDDLRPPKLNGSRKSPKANGQLELKDTRKSPKPNSKSDNQVGRKDDRKLLKSHIKSDKTKGDKMKHDKPREDNTKGDESKEDKPNGDRLKENKSKGEDTKRDKSKRGKTKGDAKSVISKHQTKTTNGGASPKQYTSKEASKELNSENGKLSKKRKLVDGKKSPDPLKRRKKEDIRENLINLMGSLFDNIPQDIIVRVAAECNYEPNAAIERISQFMDQRTKRQKRAVIRASPDTPAHSQKARPSKPETDTSSTKRNEKSATTNNEAIEIHDDGNGDALHTIPLTLDKGAAKPHAKPATPTWTSSFVHSNNAPVSKSWGPNDRYEAMGELSLMFPGVGADNLLKALIDTNNDLPKAAEMLQRQQTPPQASPRMEKRRAREKSVVLDELDPEVLDFILSDDKDPSDAEEADTTYATKSKAQLLPKRKRGRPPKEKSTVNEKAANGDKKEAEKPKRLAKRRKQEASPPTPRRGITGSRRAVPSKLELQRREKEDRLSDLMPQLPRTEISKTLQMNGYNVEAALDSLLTVQTQNELRRSRLLAKQRSAATPILSTAKRRYNHQDQQDSGDEEQEDSSDEEEED